MATEKSDKGLNLFDQFILVLQNIRIPYSISIRDFSC